MSRSTSGALGTRTPEGQSLIPVGSHVSVTDLSTVYTPECPTQATQVLIQVFASNVRFTLDGSVPSPTHGFRLTGDDGITVLPYTDQTILSFINETSGAKMELQWGA